jgi:hypothetical protein
VGTSVLVGIVALLQWQYSALPVVAGFAGAYALLYGSLLLVREARLAVRSTLQEVSFAREAALGPSSGLKPKRYRVEPGGGMARFFVRHTFMTNDRILMSLN